MDYILVPEEELPKEINELFTILGRQLGLITSGIVRSGKYAPEFYDVLSANLKNAAHYMKDTLEREMNNNAKPITKDDVLDMHKFLEDFDGDLGVK